MNALEFLNNELEDARLSFKTYKSGLYKDTVTASVFFEGVLHAVSIYISDNQEITISWFSGSRQDAKTTLGIARIMHSVGAIADKWERAIEDEKAAKQEGNEEMGSLSVGADPFAFDPNADIEYPKPEVTKEDLGDLTLRILREKEEIKAPVVTDAQVEQAFVGIVEIFEGDKDITEPVLKQLAIVKNSGHVNDMDKDRVRQYAWKFNLIDLLDWMRDNDSNEDYSKLAQALYEYEQEEDTSKTQKTYNGIPESMILEFIGVRDSGNVNMVDRSGVQYEASELGCYELVVWIEDNKRDYASLLQAYNEYCNETEETS